MTTAYSPDLQGRELLVGHELLGLALAHGRGSMWFAVNVGGKIVDDPFPTFYAITGAAWALLTARDRELAETRERRLAAEISPEDLEALEDVARDHQAGLI